jgi:hypothetical protein
MLRNWKKVWIWVPQMVVEPDKEKKMGDEKYALALPRGITTGIIFEAVEKFGLEIGQEEQSEDAFDPRTDLPTKDYVPRVVLWSDSPEKLEEAKEYIFKKHEEWITGLEDWRKMRMNKIMKKMRKR